MRELTKAVKQQITKDWNDSFPTLGVYKPMHLLRRIGPVLMGIALERDSGNSSYRPVFHVHDLCVEFPVVSLTLYSPLQTARGVDERIDVKHHADRFKDAAQRVGNMTLLPFAGDLTTEQVVGAYRHFQAHAAPVYRVDPNLFRDMALIYAWVGCQEKAKAVLQSGRHTMEGWPKVVHDRMGGLAEWIDKMVALVGHPDKLQQTVTQQILTLEVQHLPVSQLLV